MSLLAHTIAAVVIHIAMSLLACARLQGLLAGRIVGCAAPTLRWGVAPVRRAATAASAAPPASTPEYTIKELPSDGSTGGVANATAAIKFVRGHTKKLSPLARQVKGLSVPEALVQMAISPATRSFDVAKVIRRAAKQAEIYHGLPLVRSCGRVVHARGRAPPIALLITPHLTGSPHGGCRVDGEAHVIAPPSAPLQGAYRPCTQAHEPSGAARARDERCGARQAAALQGGCAHAR